MGKASRNKKRDAKNDDIAVTSISAPDQGRSWFLPVVAVIFLAGAVGVGFLATQRTSNTGVRPLLGDHWHSAYGIYECDTFLPPIRNDNDPDGIHTHGAGYIHVHPFATTAAGRNANIERFLTSAGAEVDGDSLSVPELGVEFENGMQCGEEEAVFQVAYWEDQFSLEDPVIVTGDDIPEFHFTEDGAAFTFALAPLGAEIPKPPTAAAAYG